eukprot:1150613-Pelagomonas_calceolata.AAC.3
MIQTYSLTKTKITGGVKPPQWLDHLLQDYAWWHNSHHHSGTILYVKKNIAITTQATQVQCQDNVNGRMVAAKLKTSSKPILLIYRIALKFKVDIGKGCVCGGFITLKSLTFGNGIYASVTRNSGDMALGMLTVMLWVQCLLPDLVE